MFSWNKSFYQKNKSFGEVFVACKVVFLTAFLICFFGNLLHSYHTWEAFIYTSWHMRSQNVFSASFCWKTGYMLQVFRVIPIVVCLISSGEGACSASCHLLRKISVSVLWRWDFDEISKPLIARDVKLNVIGSEHVSKVEGSFSSGARPDLEYKWIEQMTILVFSDLSI